MHRIRQEKIRAYIEEKKTVTLKELQQLVPDVTLMTLHRDLDALQNAGVLTKFRGGACAVSHSGDLEFSVRIRENIQSKQAIANKALALIKPRSSIFIDAGTTSMVLAHSLQDMDLTITTNAPNIALELGKLALPSINLCCGNLNRINLAVSGANTLEMLEKINIDLAFIGVSGCSADNGFTCGKESEMFVKNLVIRKARTSVVLCDSIKLTRLMPFTFANLSDVDYIIAEKALPQEFVDKATQSGTIVL